MRTLSHDTPAASDVLHGSYTHLWQRTESRQLSIHSWRCISSSYCSLLVSVTLFVSELHTHKPKHALSFPF